MGPGRRSHKTASSRGPQGSVTTASPLAGGLRKAYPGMGGAPAWSLGAEGGPTPAGCQAGPAVRNQAPSEGRSALHTEPRGGMQGVGAGQSQGRG